MVGSQSQGTICLLTRQSTSFPSVTGRCAIKLRSAGHFYVRFSLKIVKSSRHSKITGTFAESLVLYWLSKHGFECALVDHVGLDIIARNPHTNVLMGISVKSRSRNTGKEGTYITIPNENLTKLSGACQTFGCIPHFAIVVDEADSIAVFILDQAHFVELCPPRKLAMSWKMALQEIEWVESGCFRAQAACM